MGTLYYLVSRKDKVLFELGKSWYSFIPSKSYEQVREYIRTEKELNYDRTTEQLYFDMIAKDIAEFCDLHPDSELTYDDPLGEEFDYTGKESSYEVKPFLTQVGSIYKQTT